MQSIKCNKAETVHKGVTAACLQTYCGDRLGFTTSLYLCHHHASEKSFNLLLCLALGWSIYYELSCNNH